MAGGDRISDRELSEFISTSKSRMDRSEKRLTSAERNIDAVTARTAKAEADIVKLYEAFPGNDPEAHARYHNLLIQRNEEIRKLRMAVQEKTLSALAFVIVCWLFKAAWKEGLDSIVSTVQTVITKKGG